MAMHLYFINRAEVTIKILNTSVGLIVQRTGLWLYSLPTMV